ncbi:MAG: hypothetical protein Q9211_006802 [Gyalolechia sp. 1 TL-2023]
MDPLPPPTNTPRASSSSLSSISEQPAVSSSNESDITPVQRGRRSPCEFQDPYDDYFGLERPPPPYNLEGEWNYNTKTGRRTLSRRSKKFYPFHHEPIVYIDRQPYSNSAVQVIRKINEMHQDAMDDSWEDLPSAERELQRLKELKQFVHESAALEEWDPSGRQRSVEARMEDLLKSYGYDRVDRKVGKGKQAVRSGVP